MKPLTLFQKPQFQMIFSSADIFTGRLQREDTFKKAI